MLAIRLQRTGRKGHAQFRVIVQESRRTPSSGNVVARLGSYDPHTKVATVDIEKATTYLNNGAQPSSRVAYILQKEGVKLPSWVKLDSGKQRNIKDTEKLRRNQPEEPKEDVSEPVAEETSVEEVAAEAPSEAVETPSEEPVAEEAKAE